MSFRLAYRLERLCQCHRQRCQSLSNHVPFPRRVSIKHRSVRVSTGSICAFMSYELAELIIQLIYPMATETERSRESFSFDTSARRNSKVFLSAVDLLFFSLPTSPYPESSQTCVVRLFLPGAIIWFTSCAITLEHQWLLYNIAGIIPKRVDGKISLCSLDGFDRTCFTINATSIGDCSDILRPIRTAIGKGAKRSIKSEKIAS